MDMEEIKKEILKIIENNPKYYFHEIKSKYKDFLESTLPQKPIKEQIYVFLHGFPCCKICRSKDLYFLNIKKGYSITCSKKCAALLPSRIQNQNPSEKTKESSKETKMKKYGDPNFNNREKAKITKQKIYGDLNYNNREKAKETCILKYGAESHNQSIEIKKKQKDSVRKKYNVENISQLEIVKKKKKETFFKNYGVDHYTKTDEYKNKFKIAKNHHMQISWSNLAKDILFSKENLSKELDKKTPYQLSKEINVAFSTIYNYAIEYGLREKYLNFSTENIVSEILDSLNVKYIKNDRIRIKPKELDFYLEDYNLAIEVCGLFWHSEMQNADRTYHLKKLEMCEKFGIRLITIFEDELLEYEKLKRRIESILGRSVKKFGARSCVIKEITNSQAKGFFEENHLQNHANGKVYLGAFYNDTLVSAMSFGGLRKSLGSIKEEGAYELLRFSSTGNIPGIGSKLMSYFIEKYKPKKIISYCDRRWSIGNFYKKLGFMFVSNTGPNYWYTKNYRERQHRFSLTKHKLVLMGGNKNMTEWENAKNLGFDRIWDCGSSKWVWSAPHIDK